MAAPPAVVVLTGATGTGKSDLALALAERLAPRITLEIVSMDSALVYRHMDIGTAKPDARMRARVPHHLIDIRDPAERYSAGEFVHDATLAIDAIHARGHVPLLVGGTLLYLRALRDGLAALPEASAAVRQTIDDEAAARGWPALHSELAQVDPAAAARIAASDAQRIQRALEVYRVTGKPISHWQQQRAPNTRAFNWLQFALMPASREARREQLAARFERMLAAGLLEEVRALYRRGDLTEQHPSIRAVGYRQLWKYCAGQGTLEQARDLAVTATAQLAKRQLTWLRREPAVTPLNASDVSVLETLASVIFALPRA